MSKIIFTKILKKPNSKYHFLKELFHCPFSSYKFRNIHGKTPVLKSMFNEVATLLDGIFL